MILKRELTLEAGSWTSIQDRSIYLESIGGLGGKSILHIQLQVPEIQIDLLQTQLRLPLGKLVWPVFKNEVLRRELMNACF